MIYIQSKLQVCEETILELTLMDDVRNEILKHLDEVIAIVDEDSLLGGPAVTTRQEELIRRDAISSAGSNIADNNDITFKRNKSFVFIFPTQNPHRKDSSNKLSLLKISDDANKQLEGWRDVHIAMKVIQHIPFTSLSQNIEANTSTKLDNSTSDGNAPKSSHRHGVTSLSLKDRKKIKYIRQEFDEIDLNSTGCIDKLEFKKFLAELNVHLSRKKFNLLWRAVDEMIEDSISEDQVILFLFYEKKAALKEELEVVNEIRSIVLTYLKSELASNEKWAVGLHEVFRQFADYETSKCQDGYKSNNRHFRQQKNPDVITTQTFRLILEHFGMKVDSSGFKVLVTIMDHYDGISFQNFCELVLSPDIFKITFSKMSECNLQHGQNLKNSLTKSNESSRAVGMLGKLRRNLPSLIS